MWWQAILIVLAQAGNPGSGTGTVANVGESGLPLSGGTMSGTLDMNGNDITLDADGNSRAENGTDDETHWYHNGNLSTSMYETRLMSPVEICLGGVTSSFPALERSTTSILVQTCGTSSYAQLAALNYVSAGGVYKWSSSTIMAAATDGTLLLTDAAGTSFSLLQLGGTTSSYPAWKRNSAALEARLADDSGRAVIQAASLTLDSYTVSHEVVAGDATLGPTSPTWAVAKGGTAGGLAFDADAEEVHFEFEVPACWDAASDMTLKVYWTNESGAAIGNTETIKWDASYRSLVWGTETADNGTAVDITATYTQSGAGTDGETFITSLTIDYDDVNQPLTAGDDITMVFDRDKTGDTYASDAVVTKWEFEYTATGICDHF